MRKNWESKAKVVAEPMKPPLPQFKSVEYLPPEQSAETHVGPVVSEEVSIIRSKYWRRVHANRVSCGEVCGRETIVKVGLAYSEAAELQSKLGVKLDALGLPGLAAGISGKKGVSRSSSEERSTTHRCPQTAPKCDCVWHAEYQLIDCYTFEYRGGFWGTTPKELYLEKEEDIFDRSELLIKRNCPDCDQELVRLRREGYVCSIVARDGSLAAIFPARPDGEGTYQVSGSNDRIRFGEAVSSDLVIQFFRLTGELRDAWSKASARWEQYEGSTTALYAERRKKSGPSDRTSTQLARAVFFAGTLVALGLILERLLSASRTKGSPLEDITSAEGKGQRRFAKDFKFFAPKVDAGIKDHELQEPRPEQTGDRV
ncbi:MAG TPA: hypothetical protein VII23_04585 [Terriglobales bacterium]